MKDLKITKGVWHDSSKEVFCPNQIGIMVHGTLENRPERNFIRHLIADAGNTYQKCGLLPSDLLKQRDELLEALKEARMIMYEDLLYDGISQKIEAAITKAEEK